MPHPKKFYPAARQVSPGRCIAARDIPSAKASLVFIFRGVANNTHLHPPPVYPNSSIDCYRSIARIAFTFRSVLRSDTVDSYALVLFSRIYLGEGGDYSVFPCVDGGDIMGKDAIPFVWAMLNEAVNDGYDMRIRLSSQGAGVSSEDLVVHSTWTPFRKATQKGASGSSLCVARRYYVDQTILWCPISVDRKALKCYSNFNAKSDPGRLYVVSQIKPNKATGPE